MFLDIYESETRIVHMKRVFRILSIAFILLLIDFLMTAICTIEYGHLVDEGNPLFRSAHASWILPLNIIYLISIVITAMGYGRYDTIVCEAETAFAYVKQLYRVESSQFIIAVSCFAYIFSTFVSRGIVILDWVVFAICKDAFFQTGYAIFREQMPFGRYDIFTGLISLFVAIPLWFVIECRKSKKIAHSLS